MNEIVGWLNATEWFGLLFIGLFGLQLGLIVLKAVGLLLLPWWGVLLPLLILSGMVGYIVLLAYQARPY